MTVIPLRLKGLGAGLRRVIGFLFNDPFGNRERQRQIHMDRLLKIAKGDTLKRMRSQGRAVRLNVDRS